jgi:hypothetical protein
VRLRGGVYRRLTARGQPVGGESAGPLNVRLVARLIYDCDHDGTQHASGTEHGSGHPAVGNRVDWLECAPSTAHVGRRNCKPIQRLALKARPGSNGAITPADTVDVSAS